jgi:hypothetical protein
MAIERFTKTEFEAALPIHRQTGEALWTYDGLIENEECYRVPVRDGVVIMVRSSVKADGRAARNGKDSIRCWLADPETGKPLGSKIQSYVTRVSGWQDRMKKVIRELWKRSLTAGDCPVCGKPLGVYKVKKDGKNKGRLFAKCWDHGSKSFRWLDEPEPDGYRDRPKVDIMEPADPEDVAYELRELKYKKDRVKHLKTKLAEDDEWLLWGLLRVFDEQTADEQVAGDARYYNKVGFNGHDAEILCSFSRQFLKKATLSVKQLALAKKKMPKYAGQLIKLMAS